ncbi:MAG: DUF2125 domain-containing protein [Marivita sp.]|uniref:DUF2125 domain-containing protein n=1 Tax=Marivita sp. TaxID=2003365 RepID=UPI003EF6B5BD
MKRLLAAMIVATLTYSGWWIYASRAIQTDMAGWFEAQRTKGWEANYTDMTVRGFPNRTDLTLTDPVLMSPDGSVGWHAPFFQVLALSYKRNHVIVAWPDTQSLTTPEGEIAITSDGLRASVVRDGQDILRTSIEAPVFNLTSPNMALALADANIAVEKIANTVASYRLALSVGNVATSMPSSTAGIGPEAFASIRAEMALDFDQPLRLDALTGTPPQPTKIDIQRSEITFGAVTFRITLAATLDAQGLPTGEMSVSAENWRDATNDARINGDLPPALTDGLINLLSLLSTFNGTRDSLDVTLGLDRGTLLFGPVTVGKIPPIHWR